MTADQANAAIRLPRAPRVTDIEKHAPQAAAFLKALANDQRLLVLCALIDGSLSVGEINERVPLSQSALSQHLSVLRAAGLVTTRRESQTIYYALQSAPTLSSKRTDVVQLIFCNF